MITGKILKLHGWTEGRSIGLAKQVAGALEAQGVDRDAVLARLDTVRQQPEDFVGDPLVGALATELLRMKLQAEERSATPMLRGQALPYRVWGAEGIEPGARAQMDAAMRLPVSVAGALMPDAHQGYG